jgi:hypothetical protein
MGIVESLIVILMGIVETLSYSYGYSGNTFIVIIMGIVETLIVILMGIVETLL